MADAGVIHAVSGLSDLRTERLLRALCRLPFRFVVSLSMRAAELLAFTASDGALLAQGGMEPLELSSECGAQTRALRRRFGRLSVHAGVYLATAQSSEGGILLTGEALLRPIVPAEGGRGHGGLGIVDQLQGTRGCARTLLIEALESWKSARSIFLLNLLSARQLHAWRECREHKVPDCPS